jgi:hypothetical protein
MTEEETVKVTIEIPVKLYNAIQHYKQEPHETIEEAIIYLIKNGFNEPF